MTPLTRRHLLVGGAALAGGAVLAAPPAMAAPKGQPPQRDISRDRIRRWANDTWRSLVGHDRRGHRADRRQHRGLADQPAAQRLHLADQHRRLPVERPGGAGPQDHLLPGVQHPVGPDAEHPGHDAPERRERDVLQLVRRADRGRADHLAGRRQPGQPVPVQRGQRLAGGRADRGAERRPLGGADGAPAVGADGLRRLLQPHPAARPGSRPDARRLLGGRPAGRRRRGQLPGPGAERLLHELPLRHHGLRDPDRVLHRHRPPTGPPGPLLRDLADLPGELRLVLARAAAGRRRPAVTSASMSSRARTPTAVCTSFPAGAGRCSRR